MYLRINSFGYIKASYFSNFWYFMGILIILDLIHIPEFVIIEGITNSTNLMDYKSIGLHIQLQRESTNTILVVPQDL